MTARSLPFGASPTEVKSLYQTRAVGGEEHLEEPIPGLLMLMLVGFFGC
jgi:hypothetical protein